MGDVKITIVGLDKLIEVIAQGIGAVARPWMIRRVARAEADGLKVLDAARVEAEKHRAKELQNSQLLLEGEVAPEPSDAIEIAERTEKRITQREVQRQENLEAIAMGAADELKERESVSDQKVDEDWIARFFSSAQDVSNQDLQRLWSALLASEVSVPDSVALRTLETLKNLSPREAKLFAEVRRWIFGGDEALVLLQFEAVHPFINPLQDCGLISSAEAIFDLDDEPLTLRHGEVDVTFSNTAPKDTFGPSLGFYRLSTAGSQIARAIGLPRVASRTALKEVATQVKRLNVEITLNGTRMSLDEYLDHRRSGMKS